MKQQNLLEENWDICIILDACRFDAFELIYDNYLGGELEKRKSLGTETIEWLKKNFKEKYDLTYISANPYINSKGVGFGGWKATDHFEEIIDVWEHKWDEEKGTVWPRDVNMAYYEEKPRNKTIIHYIQPHRPWLTIDDKQEWKMQKGKINQNLISFPGIDKVLKLVGYRRLKKLKDYLKYFFVSPNSFNKAITRYGMLKSIRAYIDSLRQVMNSTSNLIDELEGKIIITSDHGEAFGERSFFGHGSEKNIKALKQVPYLKIK